MKYNNKCSLYLDKDNQQCANHKGVEHKFTKICSRLSVLSKNSGKVEV